MTFDIDERICDLPTPENPWTGPLRKYKRAFYAQDILDLFPSQPINIIDIGCGPNKYKARKQDRVIGLDQAELPGVDFVTDLSAAPFPLEANSIDMAYSSHFIEHLDYTARDHVFFEVLRVLKPGGIFFWRVPHFSHYWQGAYDHRVHNFGSTTAYAIGNALWYSKNIPFFHVVGLGFNYRMRAEASATLRYVNRLLNRSFRLTEMYTAWALGGIEEIHFLFMKPLQPPTIREK